MEYDFITQCKRALVFQKCDIKHDGILRLNSECHTRPANLYGKVTTQMKCREMPL